MADLDKVMIYESYYQGGIELRSDAEVKGNATIPSPGGDIVDPALIRDCMCYPYSEGRASTSEMAHVDYAFFCGRSYTIENIGVNHITFDYINNHPIHITITTVEGNCVNRCDSDIFWHHVFPVTCP